ncbi:MAG: YkgJ family cysteine cluster protein [Candidatus Bathyarchaeales archaeon]
MLKEVERQIDYFEICGRCKIDCCRDARPPITPSRKEIIEEYLKMNGIIIEKPFVHTEYTFPREDAEGHCIFYDKNYKKCMVHPVKPETCAAGPVTFDINKKTRKIEWYLKTEAICALAGALFKNKNALERHIEFAKKEILRLVRELNPEALRAILKRDEPDTFKIGEDEIEENVLSKL